VRFILAFVILWFISDSDVFWLGVVLHLCLWKIANVIDGTTHEIKRLK